jgi:Immunity protein 8
VLAQLVARDGVVPGRHFIFVESIDRDTVEAFIRDRLRRMSGNTWSDLAEKIGRLGYWEFEDHTPAPGSSVG